MSVPGKNSQIKQALLESDSSTEFLEQAFHILGSGRKSFSYAQFAHLAGFKARSYARALILGLKPMSLNAFIQLEKLFEFDENYAAYFKLLVAKNQQEFAEEGETDALRLERMDKLKKKILRIEGKSQTENRDEVFSSREHLIVYSCVSAKEEGTAFKEIRRLSGLDERRCRALLDELCEKDLLVKLFKNDSYRAPESLLIANKLGDREFFNDAWLDSAQILLNRAPERMKNRENLFMNSYITVPRTQLMEFRTELQGLVERFLDKWCENQGDEVVELVLGATTLQITPQTNDNHSN